MDDNEMPFYFYFFLLIFSLDRGWNDGVPLELSPGISHAWGVETGEIYFSKHKVQAHVMRSSSSTVQVQLPLMRSSSSTAYPVLLYLLGIRSLVLRKD